jgi:SAM-dependent methyltransferase
MRQAAGVQDLAGRWRAALAAWAIPPHIERQATESPWALPERLFARRADRQVAAPAGPSHARAREALGEPGSVLDVGAGAGAASLPLAAAATALTAVDVNPSMLRELASRAAAAGLAVTTVVGSWPEVADQVAPADLVVCHHVLYNVPDLPPFLAALTGHARRRVVCELTARHPMARLNPLWRRFHDLDRPEGPTAEDVVALARALGLRVGVERWRRPSGGDHDSFEDVVDLTRRRLCLPMERAAEVAAALRELGVRGDGPVDLGPQELVTLWWAGDAGRG